MAQSLLNIFVLLTFKLILRFNLYCKQRLTKCQKQSKVLKIHKHNDVSFRPFRSYKCFNTNYCCNLYQHQNFDTIVQLMQRSQKPIPSIISAPSVSLDMSQCKQILVYASQFPSIRTNYIVLVVAIVQYLCCYQSQQVYQVQDGLEHCF